MNASRTWIVAVACLFLMATAAVTLRRFSAGRHLGEPGVRVVPFALNGEDGKPVTTNSIYLPETLLGCTSVVQKVVKQELDVLPADTTYGRRIYTATNGFDFQVSGVLMGVDRTSIHKPEFCLPSQGFQILRRYQQTIPIERPHRYDLPVTRLDAIREVELKDGRKVRHAAVYVYWFVSGTRLSNDHGQRMWWLASDLVRTGELQRWAYMSLLGACAEGGEDALYNRLKAAIQELVPEIQTTTGTNLAPASLAQGR